MGAKVVSWFEGIEEAAAREKGLALSPKRRAYLRRRARLAASLRPTWAEMLAAFKATKQVRR